MTSPLLFVLSCLMFLSPAEAGADPPVPSDCIDMERWTTKQVEVWASYNGFPIKFLEATRKHSLTGAVVRQLTDGDLNEMGIASPLARKKVQVEIERCADAAVNTALPPRAAHVDVDWSTIPGAAPPSFHKLRESDRSLRALLDTLVAACAVCPHMAVYLVNQLPASARPTEQPGFLVWVFVPEYYLWRHREDIAGGLPGLIPVSLFFSLTASVITKCFGVCVQNGSQILGSQVKAAVASSLLLVVFRFVVYPIVPWFICDWCLFLAVYILPMLVWVFWACMISVVCGGLCCLATVAAAEQQRQQNLQNPFVKRPLKWE